MKLRISLKNTEIGKLDRYESIIYQKVDTLYNVGISFQIFFL